MSAGPGKYDDACTAARVLSGGRGAVLIIIDGDRGAGISVQVPPEMVSQLPKLLEALAEGIRQDQKNEGFSNDISREN